jgi:putative Holliday junction resolvase
MSVWLGIDHGHKRVGVASGSTADAIAVPVEVLDARDEPALLHRLAELTSDYAAGGIVVGLPINMDDTLGPQARQALDFAERVADACNCEVRLWDERLSSFAADEALAGHLTRRKRRARQDAVAAATILRDFLEQDGPNAAPTITEVHDWLEQGGR